MKKKSIFHKKMEDPEFKAVYEKTAMKLNIGEEIARLRHERKLTQQELARKVHSSRPAIARYERGDYARYNLITLLKIAEALNAKLDVSLRPR